MLMWKVVNIIVGFFNMIFKRRQALSNYRLDICRGCNERVKIKIIGDFCSLCGCKLKAKTTVLNEKCELGKW